MTHTKLPILIVGYLPRNLELLGQFLEKIGYTVLAANNLPDFAAYVDGTYRIGLALVDITGFDRVIWEHCQQCRDLDIPLLIISAQQIPTIHQESMTHGAHGVLFKPLVMKELVSLVNNLALKE